MTRFMLISVGLFVAGCGWGGSPMGRVSGVVTLDGKPIEGAAVGFVAVGDGPVASGTTDAEGRYTLTCMNQSGTLVGEYRVVVCKTIEHGIRADGTVAPGGARTEWLTPRKYASHETSGLSATIRRGNNEIPLELSSW